MRNPKRVLTIAVVLATALVMAMPAGAKKPPKPSDPPVLMDVTMSGALATTCDDGDGIDGVMVMARDSQNGFSPVNLAILYLDIPGMDTSRLYPAPTSSTGFTGCHGEQLDGNASPLGGLVITLDDTGAVTDLFWHFDYYLETTTRGKSGKTMVSLLEHFTLSGHELMWDPETSTASGWVNVLYHLEDSVNQESVGYEPVEGSPVFLEFTLTMTPHS